MRFEFLGCGIRIIIINKRQDIRRLNYRMEKISIDDVELHLSAPDDVSMSWVGQEDLVTQVLAAWLVIGLSVPGCWANRALERRRWLITPGGASPDLFTFFRPRWIPGPRT